MVCAARAPASGARPRLVLFNMDAEDCIARLSIYSRQILDRLDKQPSSFIVKYSQRSVFAKDNLTRPASDDIIRSSPDGCHRCVGPFTCRRFVAAVIAVATGVVAWEQTRHDS